ncbi:glypican-1b [Stigmatopora nigra]
MDSRIVEALVLCLLMATACGDKGSGKARSCLDIRHFYTGKGFSLDGVPQSEISGEHLRICPQGYTCCTSDMEDNLAMLSRGEMEGLLKDAGRSLQVSLGGQFTAFDGYFLELLNQSATTLQETFASTWKSFYSENSQVFAELYAELWHYYRGSNINLEDALNDFWAKLLEKLFSHANKQYSIGDDYLECVSKQLEILHPFGDGPHDLKTKVTRTFVAARSFVQGLVVSGEVVRKVSQVPLSQECMRAIMRMNYCPHCRGMASARPCVNYCSNVLKGCLANQADLNTEWRHLAETMIQVSDRFDGPSGVDVVVLSLPYRISEAMMAMVENMESTNNKLFLACGPLREKSVGGTETDISPKNEKVSIEERSANSANKLVQLVSDVTIQLRNMQPYWISLPRLLCSDRVATGEGAEDRCWNGMTRARYLPEVIGDGLASQINNPEVEIDITKPDRAIRQQIMQLKIMTHRLKNALNGNDVDFQDTSDDSSGSGSGTICNDEVCSRGPQFGSPVTERPVYPYPPENKKVVKGSVSQNLPCVVTYLISLLVLLLRLR